MFDVTLNPPPRALTPWSAPLSRAEVRAELIVVTGLIAAVAALFLACPDARAADPLLVLLSICLLALTQGARIDIPGGWTAPIVLVVVPVLFLLPPWLVPVSVAAALTLARVPDVVQGRAGPVSSSPPATPGSASAPRRCSQPPAARPPPRPECSSSRQCCSRRSRPTSS